MNMKANRKLCYYKALIKYTKETENYEYES